MQEGTRKIRTSLGLTAAVLLMLLGLSPAVWGHATPAEGELPAELRVELQRLRWTDEAIEELKGQPADWSRFQARDAKLVATALRYAQDEDGEIGAQEQAQLALQICAMVREMESLGYGETAAARAVFAGVRASLQEMAAWRSGGGEGELEQRIRSRFRHELRVQTAEQTKAQVRERTRAGNSFEGEGPVVGPGPEDRPGRS
jgi:hypothetical protein